MQEKPITKASKSVDKKNILIFGAGSLGCYLAAKLYAMGHYVDVIGREKSKNINGVLYINDEKYDFPKVETDLDPNKYYHYIVVTSKYYDLKMNLEQIMGSGVRFDTLVLIQNTYIDNIWYYNLIKNKPMVIISVIEGFNLEGNHIIFRPATGWFVEDDLLGRDVYNLFKTAGVNVNLTDDINVRRAEKSIANCSINIFAALYGKTLGDLFSDKMIFSRMQGVFDEAYDVMSELVPLRSKKVLWRNFVANYKELKDHEVTAHQDVKRNKKTELAFLNGFIIEVGRKMGIPTPNNSTAVAEFIEKYPELY